MKKLFLAVAIVSVSLVNAKTLEVKECAKIENDIPLQLCTVAVTYYNSAGQVSGYGAFSSDQPTLSSCQAYQQSVIDDLRAKGYRVSGGVQKEVKTLSID